MRGDHNFNHITSIDQSIGNHDSHDPGHAYKIIVIILKQQSLEKTLLEMIQLSTGIAKASYRNDFILAVSKISSHGEPEQINTLRDDVLSPIAIVGSI